MDKLVSLINTDQPPARRVERFWFEPGQRARLGMFRWMTVQAETDAYSGRRKLRLHVQDLTSNFTVPACAVVNLTVSCGLRLVPLAIEHDEAGACRVFIEFQKSGFTFADRAASKQTRGRPAVLVP